MSKSQLTALDLLKIKYPENSKTSLQKWIKHGRIVINGRVVKRDQVQVQEGDEVVLQKKIISPFSFPVLFEDADLIVVDKPPSLLSVASLDPNERSVHEYLKKHFRPNKVYPVHRLDREVSGPLIFAKSERANSLLKEAFYEKKVKREYKALLHGKLEGETGTWESYLEERANYKVHVTDDRGKHAVTHYRVLDQNDEATLVALTLDTGRKNQLRVHSQKANHPIFGDKKYGYPDDDCFKLALFAHKLAFEHPITLKQLVFEVEPPKFFKRLLCMYRFKKPILN